MNKRSQQQGFTLIELIVVIVILGILAVTAAPKFIDFTDKADESAILGLKGAIEGAMTITYADAAINGVTGEPTSSDQGTVVTTVYGYPAATELSLLATMSISAADDLTADYVYDTDTGEMAIAPSSNFASDATISGISDITGSGCYVLYTEATSATAGATVISSCTAPTP